MSLNSAVAQLAVVSFALMSTLTAGCQSTYGVTAGGATQTVVTMGAAPAGAIGHPDQTANEFGMKGP